MANPMVSHRKRRSPERWSDLPGELLYTIFANLANPLDVYRCGIVCVSWKSVIKTILPHFLLHNSNIYNRYSGNDKILMFFNILTKKIHKMPVSKFLGRFSTSNFGRLLTVAFLKIRDTYRIRLLNPFSGQEIKLPSLTDREYYTVKLRAITSTSPSDPNCLVLAFAVNLFFCRPGDEDWIKIHGFWNVCSDIIFYKGHFYVVNFDNDLFCIHCNGPVTSEKLPLQPIEFQRILISRHCSYLVELDGNLLLVVRYVSSEIFGYRRTFRFQVYELNWQEKKWIEIKSISDSMILLGRMNSISLYVGEFTNLKANCIYFISDDVVTIQDRNKDKIIDHDNGLYNMATEHFENFYGSAPIWIYPLTWFRLKL